MLGASESEQEVCAPLTWLGKVGSAQLQAASSNASQPLGRAYLAACALPSHDLVWTSQRRREGPDAPFTIC